MDVVEAVRYLSSVFNEDVAQETAVRTVAKGGSHPKRYWYVVGLNVTREWWRRDRMRPEIERTAARSPQDDSASIELREVLKNKYAQILLADALHGGLSRRMRCHYRKRLREGVK